MPVTVLRSADELAPYLEEWDALALACRRPMSAPAWMLAWWRHLAPPGSALAVAAVRDGGELIGVVPLYRRRRRMAPAEHRLLGIGHRAEPLARTGRERQVADLAAPALAVLDPRPRVMRLDAIDSGSPWPRILAEAWPGRRPLRVSEDSRMSAPTISLAGRTHAEWIEGRSANFRQTLRRRWRRLQEAGAVLRLSDEDSMAGDVRAFARLHVARWGSGSSFTAQIDAVARMIADAGGALSATGRLRLWCMDLDGVTVSAQLFVCAGGEVCYWGGGWDPRLAERSPALLTIHAAVEDAFARGEARVDLGGGAQPYKLRFADDDAPLVRVTLLPRDAAYPVVATADRLAPERLRGDLRLLYMRQPPERRALLKRLIRRR